MLAKMRMWHHRRWSVGERTETCPFMEVFDVFGYRCQEMGKGRKERHRHSGKVWDVGGVSGTFSARSVLLLCQLDLERHQNDKHKLTGVPTFTIDCQVKIEWNTGEWRTLRCLGLFAMAI